MRLRTQILIFFLVFGLAPLLSAVIINLPLVFGSLELFYQKAHLQNLRADFRDLDQHLASRHEMVRLLAKLPEPGAILGESDDSEQIDLARARYTQWVNQILLDQLDIIQILFLDEQGQERFWLERDPETQQWRPTTHMPERPPEDFVRTAPRLEPGGVLVSLIRVNPELGALDPRRLINLHLMSPIVTGQQGTRTLMGAVVISIDVGGIAKFYRNTLWVKSDGSYLGPDSPDSAGNSAFQAFPGLERVFAAGNLDLWKGPRGEQVLWVPLLRTEDSGPLWVGRQVDPSPLAAFRNALVLRVLVIILLLIGLVWVMARWVAVRLERFGHELTRGIRQMLKADEAVEFRWHGPRELEALGENLTELARTHAEHAQSLRAHARELEESNRYKSEFLANVSHELRTPLNSILLLSKMLAQDDAGLAPEQRRQAGVIHDAGRDLQSLIDNILDHSRIEAGEVSLHPQWLEPAALLGSILELVRPQFEQKQLYLRLELDPSAPTRIRSDRDRLSQIIKNFLANAVKFTDQGGVTVRVEPLRNGGCPVAIRVSDTGIGIPRAKHDLVFEAFKQADGSTSRRHGGTGLGLSISRELARLLGGAIELDSDEGRGATFSLLLPLDMVQTAEEQPAPPPAVIAAPGPDDVPEAIPQADFSGHCVLLVERDVSALLQLTPLLESWGLLVSAAADQEEALDSLGEDEPWSLVLVSASVPPDDACATIGAIRADSRFAALRVIAMTPRDQQGAEEDCLRAGATALLERPVQPQALKSLLEQFLAAENPEAPGPPS